MFAPFLERMAASLPYYKGLPIRANPKYPRVDAWFTAMESRPSYRHIQSDYYTHVHDLPPQERDLARSPDVSHSISRDLASDSSPPPSHRAQVGRCQMVPEAQKYADAIDGSDGSWSLPLPEEDALQPLHGLAQPPEEARCEAAERLMSNSAAVARFAARGAGSPGFPPVGAPLSDPNATPDEGSVPQVEAALRHVCHALLAGPDAAAARLSPGMQPATITPTLGYLRDRVSVPRDMSYPAARQLRAHLNWMIEATAKAAQ